MQVESLPTFNQPISWLKEQDEAAPRERENSQQPQQLQQQNVVSDGDCDMLKPIADSTQATTPCSRVLYANFQPASQPVVQSHNNQFPPPALVGEKYLIFEQVDSSTLCRCINVHTHEEVICKVVGGREADSMLAAHYRLDGHLRVNKLQEVLLGSKFLYLVFPRSYGDLHSHVRTHKRLCEREARHFFLQIADTVKACHENGIVLRDLKLRKFVFADAAKTQLKLETLEDAVILENPDDDLLQDKRGCPAYVSPEILRSHAQYSGRAADMWSLGVILYTMLVGRYPFNDNEHVSLFAKISRGHFIIPEHLSPKARCLIRSLLRREPSERMTAEDVLLHPWLSQEEDDDYPSRFDQLVPVFRA